MFGEVLKLSKTRYQHTELISEPLYKMLNRLLEWCAEYQNSLENLVTDSESPFWGAVKDPDEALTEEDGHFAQTIVDALKSGELSERPYIFSLSQEFAPSYVVQDDVTCQCDGDTPEECLACVTGCDWAPGELITLSEIVDACLEVDIGVFYEDGECRFEAGFVVDGDDVEDDPYTQELGSVYFFYEDPVLGQQIELCLDLLPDRADPDASAETLAEWARDENEAIRARAGAHPSCSLELLTTLSKDSSASVMAAVAHNPNTDSQLLHSLATNDGWRLQDAHIAVAQNPTTTALTLELLATSKHEKVRAVVAENPKTPRHVVEAIQNIEPD